ncbi:MAG: TrmH family RNA methyltransferase [Patescibacteria group bacterium]
MPDTRLILDNIRSTHNVGSIFRTADAAGVSKIYCIGTTPAPVDRFGRKRRDVAKVSLGAEDAVAWEHSEDGVKLIKTLKKDGFSIVALEQDRRSVDYRDISFSDKNTKLAVILGNEMGGVSEELLKRSDMIIEIPMKGKKESLNVSVVTGIILFHLNR